MPLPEKVIMEIEKAKLRHSPLLAEMNHQLIRDEGHRNKMNQSQLARRMRNWLGDGYQAFLFKAQDKVIGYCLFRKEKEFIYLRQFYVDRLFRRKGLGRKAFSLLRDKAWKSAPGIRLDVLVQNRAGIGFWKALGFKDYCLTMERKA
jgi:ribosomal protein S18 acetylase RimI-like enzyme